jgi:hypothetical protein
MTDWGATYPEDMAVWEPCQLCDDGSDVGTETENSIWIKYHGVLYFEPSQP